MEIDYHFSTLLSKWDLKLTNSTTRRNRSLRLSSRPRGISRPPQETTKKSKSTWKESHSSKNPFIAFKRETLLMLSLRPWTTPSKKLVLIYLKLNLRSKPFRPRLISWKRVMLNLRSKTFRPRLTSWKRAKTAQDLKFQSTHKTSGDSKLSRSKNSLMLPPSKLRTKVSQRFLKFMIISRSLRKRMSFPRLTLKLKTSRKDWPRSSIHALKCNMNLFNSNKRSLMSWKWGPTWLSNKESHDVILTTLK